MQTGNTQGSNVPGPKLAIFSSGGKNDLDMYDSLTTSTFDTVVLWSMNVDPEGNILIRNFTQSVVAGNGKYNPFADPDIDTFRNKVRGLKANGGKVVRVELSFGVGSYWSDGKIITDPTFPNIKAIYDSQLKGPSAASKNLLANLLCLQKELNADALSFDDEVQYDQASSLWLAQQCGSMGMKVTICPCGDMSYWSGLVKAANATGTLIDAVYLQAWATGVQGWVIGGMNPNAGMWVYEDQNNPLTPAGATAQISAWNQQQALSGGWYYNASDMYDNHLDSFTNYANAIQAGLNSGTAR